MAGAEAHGERKGGGGGLDVLATCSLGAVVKAGVDKAVMAKGEGCGWHCFAAGGVEGWALGMKKEWRGKKDEKV